MTLSIAEEATQIDDIGNYFIQIVLTDSEGNQNGPFFLGIVITSVTEETSTTTDDIVGSENINGSNKAVTAEVEEVQTSVEAAV